MATANFFPGINYPLLLRAMQQQGLYYHSRLFSSGGFSLRFRMLSMHFSFVAGEIIL
jgi:hypothetical protein